MRVVLLAILLTSLLAGCASKDADETVDATDTGATDVETADSGSNDTIPDAPLENATSEPAGSDAPALNATLVEAKPLRPNSFDYAFHFNVSVPDNETRLVAFDGDGDGTTDVDASINGTGSLLVQYTYAASGTYDASLTLGEDAFTFEIVVPEVVSQHVEGSVIVGADGCWIPVLMAEAGAGAGFDDFNGITHVDFDVDAATYGLPFTADFSFDTGYLSVAIIFAMDDATFTHAGSYYDEMPAFGDKVISGTVPEGAVYGDIYLCGGPVDASVVYHAQ